MGQPRERLILEDVDGVTVVTFVDKRILDEQNIQVIGEELFRLVDTRKLKKVLLDFTGVTFLSSVMLGKLITLNKMATGGGGRLVMCSFQQDIFEVFETTKLDKLFKIRETRLDALG